MFGLGSDQSQRGQGPWQPSTAREITLGDAAALSVLMLMLAVKIPACRVCFYRAVSRVARGEAKADGNTLPFRYLGIKPWPDDCTRASSKKLITIRCWQRKSEQNSRAIHPVVKETLPSKPQMSASRWCWGSTA